MSKGILHCIYMFFIYESHLKIMNSTFDLKKLVG